MLYDRWREIARAHSHDVALRDWTSGRQWTFAELDRAAESGGGEAQPIVFPQGNSPEFVFDVLRAWRSGRIVCPLEPDQTRLELPNSFPRNIAHFKTTSATTGAARLIAFTGEQLAADAANIVATMGLRPEWPNLGVISLAHSYGFSNLVLPLLLHGIPLILGGAPLPEAVKRAAAAECTVTLAAVPALWRNWHEAGAIPANVRLAISAGAPLPLNVEHSIFATHGLKIHNFYGASECGGIAYDSTSGPRRDAACVGAPMRNVELSVSDDGCLQVGGGAVGKAYWPDSSPKLRDGIFITSDLAEISFGMVYLRGRVTDQINVAGRKVSPESIEKILLTNPAVRDCLVFGAPSEESNRGETIVACVVSASETSGETLRQFLLEKIPAWQVPRDWNFVESLEVNHRGKRSRAEWRAKYLQNSTARS